MTASAPAREPGRAPVPIHPLAVRITHWLNAIAILIMIGSGWRIWNSSPIFDFHFPVGITLGGDVELSQDVHNETGLAGDRKSTRLNSSHGYISYAVFCLKKKKQNKRYIFFNNKKKNKSILNK